MEAPKWSGPPSKDSTSSIPANSLLGLPVEVRLILYRHLFKGRKIRALTTVRDGEASYWTPRREANDRENIMMDDGITLTCKLLRAEAVPVVRQNLVLHCDLVSMKYPVEVLVKSDILKSIREAYFVLGSIGVPVLQLPSLETLHMDFSNIIQPHMVIVTAKGATAGSPKGVVEDVKARLLWGTAIHKCDHGLKDPKRKFKIIWRHPLELVGHGGATLVDDMRLTFDWDTLAITEGMEEIQFAFSKMKQ